VTLLGLLAFPAMLKAGYNKQFAAGTVTASGTLGILIPPSVLLILYGFVAGVSVPRLYAGAFLPGFMLSSLYLGYIVVRAALRPADAPRLTKEQREQLTGATSTADPSRVRADRVADPLRARRDLLRTRDDRRGRRARRARRHHPRRGAPALSFR
jgi:TRAP-type mannitol/chloroaromatic compound transport system permease large subunit